MSRFQFKVGDVVRSTYRGRWVGVVLDRRSQADAEPVYELRVVLEPNGRPMSKHIRSKVFLRSERWLRAYRPRDAEEVEVIRLWSDPETRWSQLPEAARQMKRGRGPS